MYVDNIEIDGNVKLLNVKLKSSDDTMKVAGEK